MPRPLTTLLTLTLLLPSLASAQEATLGTRKRGNGDRGNGNEGTETGTVTIDSWRERKRGPETGTVTIDS